MSEEFDLLHGKNKKKVFFSIFEACVKKYGFLMIKTLFHRKKSFFTPDFFRRAYEFFFTAKFGHFLAIICFYKYFIWCHLSWCHKKNFQLNKDLYYAGKIIKTFFITPKKFYGQKMKKKLFVKIRCNS